MTSAAQADSGTTHLRSALPSAVDPCALSLNENPLPPLPAVRAALVDFIGAANRYPEFLPTQLRRLVADHAGVAEENVALGPGASGLAMRVLQTAASPGERIVLSKPTFEGYPAFAQMAGLTAVDVPLDSYGHYDLTAMAQAAAQGARVVVLCRPHNPTGTRIGHDALAEFLARVDPSVTVVFDEAYVDFVPVSDRVETAELIERHVNLVVMRTFSKAYGLAALRVGYAFGSAAVIARIRRWQLPFGMTALAEAGVQACYAAESELAVRTETITQECDRLTVALRDLGYRVPTSSANFAA